MHVDLIKKAKNDDTALKTSTVKPQELQIQPQVNADPCSHSFKYLISTAHLVYLCWYRHMISYWFMSWPLHLQLHAHSLIPAPPILFESVPCKITTAHQLRAATRHQPELLMAEALTAHRLWAKWCCWRPNWQRENSLGSGVKALLVTDMHLTLMSDTPLCPRRGRWDSLGEKPGGPG